MTQLVNAAKVDRAQTQLKKEGRPVTDEAVLELYKKFGGLVVEKVKTKKSRRGGRISQRK